MRILIDLTSLADNFSGIERYAACIAKELLQYKEHTWCLVFKNGIHPILQPYIQEKNVDYKVLKGCNKLLFNQVVLPAAISKIKADYYLFLAFPPPVLLFRKNMIAAVHDICYWDCPETMTKLSKWYFRISSVVTIWKCRTIITISDFSKQRIAERLKVCNERILCIGCGVDEQFKHKEERKSQVLRYDLPDEYILSLSTVEPRKNIRLLLEAYQTAVVTENREMPPLVLAGRKGWKAEHLLQQIDQEVLNKIRFTGFIDDADLPAIYSGAKLFVFPSLYEGFGIPPLEAMTCGTPVLSSDAASLPEVLGDAAHYFESENVRELTQELIKMVNLSEEKWEVFRKKGIDRAGEYAWSREAKKLMGFLNKSSSAPAVYKI